MKCPLLETFRHVTVSVRVQKSNIFKVCAQHILHVLKFQFKDVNVAA